MQNIALAQKVAAAIGHHRAGRLAEAEAVYNEILKASPEHIDSLHLSGLIASQRGNHRVAIERIGKAIALTRTRPVAALHNNLGVALRGAGQPDRAAAHFGQAVALKPDYAEAHTNLGAALQDLGRLDDAAVCSRRAVELTPQAPMAHYAFGAVLQQQEKLEEARACYEQAIRLKPDYADAHINLGTVLTDLGKPAEALAPYRRAVAFKPAHPNAHYNLGRALERTGQPEAALECYRQAQTLKPDYAEAHWNEALIQLARGDLAAGWRKYEWRWRLPGMVPRGFPQPAWRGEDGRDRTILIHAEQGFGDTLQFIRYARLARERVGMVIVECQPSLTSLLERTPGIDRLVARGEPLPAFDYQVPMLSMPGILGTTIDNIPADIPYLRPSPDRVTAWHARMAGIGELKVGLVWRGNPGNSQDRARSLSAAAFAGLPANPGIRCFILQQDASQAEIDALSQHGAVTDCGPDLTDWGETAALISELDLVVTVDTAVAHLAGALGKPVWILLTHIPHWCWLTDREDSPWYPTARLFRQPETGAWEPVQMRVRGALAEWSRKT